MRSIGVLLVFAMVAMVVAAYPLSRIFVEDFNGVMLMGQLIMAFAIGTVPFSMVFVLQRAFYSLEDTRTVFFIVLAKSMVFVAGLLVVATLPAEDIGLAVALLTSVISFIYFGIAFVVLRRKLGRLDGRLLLWRHIQYLGAGLVAGGAGFGVLALLGGLRPDGFAVASVVTAVISLAVLGIVMLAVYTAVLAAIRNPELRAVTSTLTSRFGRRRSE
jgi:putative peptidoglycan lipid II flippase